MAKISTYPGPSSPSLSDMLIGTDVNDMLMTKNFTISDIISVAGSSTYVPYTGATGNVDLGANTLTADSLYSTTLVDTNTITFSGSSFVIASAGFTNIGLNIDIAANKYFLGDTIGSLNSTTIVVDDFNSRIELNGSLYTDGSTGTLGQLLQSQGAGLPATWFSPNYVPYTGGNNDVFLPGYGFYANEFVVYGGTSSQFLKADGSIDSNVYALASSLTGFVPYTGATADVDLNSYRLITDAVLAKTSTQILYLSPSPFDTVGAKFEFFTGVYSFGDYSSLSGGTYIKIDDANTRIELSKGIYTNGSQGVPGQFLTSQGAGLPATWAFPTAFAFGSFYDINSHSTAGSTEEYMQFGLSQGANGVSIVNNGLGKPTQITVAQTGVYNIQFSAQLTKTGGTVADVNIYFKKNGVNLGASNTIVTLANNNHYVVAAWNIFIQLNAGQYAEIVWYTTNANVQLTSIPVAVPPVDTVPSVILTVNRIF